MFSENIFSYYLIDHPSSKMIEEVTEVWGKEALFSTSAFIDQSTYNFSK